MNIRLPKVGDRVNIIEKRNYESGQLSSGVVRRTLSNPNEVHPRGNKVELEDGTVGRMVSFVDEVGVQQTVDPALREEITREIRDQVLAARGQSSMTGGQMSDNRGQRVENRGPRTESRDQRPDNREPRRDFQNRSDRYGPRDQGPAPTPEPPVRVSDLPGEDDLR